MKTPAKILLAGVCAGALVAGVVAVRTMGLKPASAASDVKVAGSVAYDRAAAAQHLSQAIQIQTVSHQDRADDDPAQWDRLHAWLQTTYPAAHKAMAREVVADHGLIYTWKGSDPALDPIILMAHQDVVPVTPGTEGDWKHAPFAGEIAEGAVWGRGPSTTRVRWSPPSRPSKPW